ncbi:WD repeat-containing protein wrap73 [Mortierella sp. GBA30]|nr:WD repeat-containing protein wrap73 [Mortierella sp. GBA30]
MDFTEPYKHSQLLTLYSPNGKYLASYHLAQEGFTRLHPSAPFQPQEDGGRGVIIFRFAATMQIMRVIEIRLFRDSLPTISEIGWSPDSTLLLAACPVTGTVQVYSVDDEDFKATITVPGINSNGSSSSASRTLTEASTKTTATIGKHHLRGEERHLEALKLMGYTPPGAGILRGVRFSADSRHILIWEENLLRVSVWSLESTDEVMSSHSLSQPTQPHLHQHLPYPKVLAIQYPKAMSKSSITSYSAPPFSTMSTTATTATGPGAQYAYSLRGDLQYLAVVERRDCRDYVSIYATEDYWTRPPIHTFGVSGEEEGGIKDAEGIVWSPDGRYLVVWENPSFEFKVAVYSMDGRCIGGYENKSGNDGQIQGGGHHWFSSGGGGLGVKSICWHPHSKLLVLGGYDQKIRMLNSLTWIMILEFHHTAYVNYGPKTVVWRESDSTVAVTGNVRIQGGVEYSMVDQPAWIPTTRIDTQKPNAKIGVGWCDFNSDGTLLASRNDNMPNVLWIWSMRDLQPLVIIQQQSPIKVIRWDPNSPSRIVWCCGTSRVYSWRESATEHGGIVEAIEVPAEGFEVTSLKWCPDGRGLLLLDNDMFCLGFPIEEQEQFTIHDNTASIFSRLR